MENLDFFLPLIQYKIALPFLKVCIINTSVTCLVTSKLSTESKHTWKSMDTKREEKIDGSVWIN